MRKMKQVGVAAGIVFLIGLWVTPSGTAVAVEMLGTGVAHTVENSFEMVGHLSGKGPMPE